jgi:hypothetical protein
MDLLTAAGRSFVQVLQLVMWWPCGQAEHDPAALAKALRK